MEEYVQEVMGLIKHYIRPDPQRLQAVKDKGTQDLVLDLRADQTTYAVGDEFHQYYTRIPETK